MYRTPIQQLPTNLVSILETNVRKNSGIDCKASAVVLDTSTVIDLEKYCSGHGDRLVHYLYGMGAKVIVTPGVLDELETHSNEISQDTYNTINIVHLPSEEFVTRRLSRFKKTLGQHQEHVLEAYENAIERLNGKEMQRKVVKDPISPVDLEILTTAAMLSKADCRVYVLSEDFHIHNTIDNLKIQKHYKSNCANLMYISMRNGRS
jgi:rRNA maturation endonuclease Nob1